MPITFSPEHSELATNPIKLQHYVEALEVAFGNSTRVVGILEIGSFAKGEAVPSSDIDTRIYVTSPAAYLVNLGIANDQGPPLYDGFVKRLVGFQRDSHGKPLGGVASKH